MTLLEQLKVYFNLTSSDYDEPIQLIIEHAQMLQTTFGFAESLIWNVCLEDVEQYLKNGIHDSFTTANENTSLTHYSESLRELLRSTMMAKVYPSSGSPVPPPKPIPTTEDIVKTIEKVSGKLYTIKYPQMLASYKEADEYMKNKFINGGCSGFVASGLHGRSFDFYRFGSACLVIKSDKTDTSLASLSVASGVSGLSPRVLDNKLASKVFNYLPYMVVDGINEAHVSVQVNMIPKDSEPSTGTNPDRPDLCSTMVCKLLLDKCEDIEEALTILNKYNVYDPKLAPFNMAYQWLISSPFGSKLLFIEDNEFKAVTLKFPVVTNFNPYKPVTIHGQGQERYMLLSAGIDSVSSVDDAKALLEEVKYSHTYDTDTEWYSEYYDTYSDGFEWTSDTDVTSERCQEILATARQMYLDGDPSSWESLHAVVYDDFLCEMHIAINEDYTQWETISI